MQDVTKSIVKAFQDASDKVTKLLGLEREHLSIAPGHVET